MSGSRYGFAIDTIRCVGCHTCSIACKIENNLPDDVIWNRVLTNGGASMDTASGTFPNLSKEYVRSFNWDEPTHSIGFAVGDTDAPEHQKHTVEKCTMCWHRLARGEEPTCVEACLAKARHWGDLDDPNSEISKLIASREYKQLLPEEGTKPSVYYLV